MKNIDRESSVNTLILNQENGPSGYKDGGFGLFYFKLIDFNEISSELSPGLDFLLGHWTNKLSKKLSFRQKAEPKN